jgi:1-deoxy-D-xylulose-5-phosphate synthase
LTTKGKGYPAAEKNPSYFHGVGPFDLETNDPAPKKPSEILSYTEVFGRAITDLAEKDIRLVAITAAMPEGTGLNQFAQRFPQRFFDVGIAEQHAVSFAAGMALDGLRPVVALYSTFLQRAYDQVLEDVCLQNIPVIFALDRAGIVGEDGPTHQGLFDLSFLRTIPNLVIMAPKDERELRDMLSSALTYERPVAIRYPRGAGVGVYLNGPIQSIPLGKWETLQEGNDLAVLATGNTVYPVLEAAGRLVERGKKALVVNARFVKPVDAGMLAEIGRKFETIITVEENTVQGGFGSAVMEKLHEFKYRGVRVRMLGIPDCFVEQGSPQKMRNVYGLDAEGIFRVMAEELNLEGVF